MTSGSRVSLDGTTMAAHASRRQFLNQERLEKRRELIEENLEHVQRGESIVDKPGWLAGTPSGLRQQKHRYEQPRR